MPSALVEVGISTRRMRLVCRSVAKHLTALADELEEIEAAVLGVDAATTGHHMDTLAVGDPDPTHGAGGLCCHEGSSEGYSCTRDPRHSGQHVATDGETVLAVWPA